MKKEITKENTIFNHLIFTALMIIAVVFAIWKCSYGFGGNDEAFYLTIPHRLLMGDSLLNDEWHLSQLSGFLLIPFVGIFEFITKSTEGIILAMRIIYIIFHSAVSVFIYIRLREYKYISMASALLYFLFTPFDIMALSYNTMALDLLVFTGVLMATADIKKKTPFIISGIAFSMAVLCCPYMAFAYILFGICVAVHYALKKTKYTNTFIFTDMFSAKTFLWFTVGVGIMAVIFVAFVLSRTSLSEILKNLPYILNDPEHPQLSIAEKLELYYTSVLSCHPLLYISFISYAIVLLFIIFDKKRKQHSVVYLIASTVVTIFTFILFTNQLIETYFNVIMFPMIFIGITSYILCDNKPKKLFASVFVLGLLYSVAVCFSSNQYFYVILMAIAVSNVASLIFLAVLIKEITENNSTSKHYKIIKNVSIAMAVTVIGFQGVLQIIVKAEHCFWETQTPQNLVCQIENGPAKGIYTSSINCLEYNNIYEDIKSYSNLERGNILFLTEKCWCYLAVEDFPLSTFSAWVTPDSSTLTRLQEYYSLNPKKIPQYIYISKSSMEYFNLTDIYAIASTYNYTAEENDISYKLTKTDRS
ncbi:MAG: hypothetical protein U0M12_09185 [Acutalibacteraceae bacterium]|nr:hypothetical protein [Acutalibacteraceae bacterium]